MIDSALGLNPKDMSEAARAKRVMQGLKQLDGITFVARIMVEPTSDPRYRDQNRLANVVLPDEPQYTAVMKGEVVEPDPVNAKPRKPEAPPQTAPAWVAQASPATAPQTGGPSFNQQPANPATGPAWLNG